MIIKSCYKAILQRQNEREGVKREKGMEKYVLNRLIRMHVKFTETYYFPEDTFLFLPSLFLLSSRVFLPFLIYMLGIVIIYHIGLSVYIYIRIDIPLYRCNVSHSRFRRLVVPNLLPHSTAISR